MTRKHFIELADALRRAKPAYDLDIWRDCVEAVAKVCAATNIRFDHKKFIERCES